MVFVTNMNGEGQRASLKTWINCKGNWNKDFKEMKPVYTKPMANFTMVSESGEELEYSFCLAHKDLLALIKLYVEADEMSILMINENDSGIVKVSEKKLTDKIRWYLDILESKEVKKC